ncbi:MAG: saccharopine dehydrogenase [Bacteroidetes bacterium]|nr:MAG: saccharopine dehydrogenase [Bacteroidota bacterium]
MKNILICGAGRSATDLIDYMLKHAEEHDWNVTVGDISVEAAATKIDGHPRGKAVFFDSNDEEIMQRYIKDADIVISVLPPGMHAAVAKVAVEYNAHVVTASYASSEMLELHEKARNRGLTLLNELGADPGIDHMNGMRSVDRIKAKGGELLAFTSFCGSLVTPESNDNPWGYKFTWSPMNVITAGDGGARYYQNNQLRCVPYHRLFADPHEVNLPGFGKFEAYANRDSLPYRKKYHLEDIPTMIRATLRFPGYCEGWNAMIQLGLTANNYRIEGSENLTYRQWISSYLPRGNSDTLEEKLAQCINTAQKSELFQRILWTDLLTERPITRVNGTPAEILLDLLLDKWEFKQGDTDMLVFYDRQEYKIGDQFYEHLSYMVTKGQDHAHTAISRTVGLPAAIGAKLILNGEIKSRGVVFPLLKEVYEPILNELDALGIGFTSHDNRIEKSQLLYS